MPKSMGQKQNQKFVKSPDLREKHLLNGGNAAVRRKNFNFSKSLTKDLGSPTKVTKKQNKCDVHQSDSDSCIERDSLAQDSFSKKQIIIKDIRNFKLNKNKTNNIAQLCVNVEQQLNDELKQVSFDQVGQNMM